MSRSQAELEKIGSAFLTAAATSRIAIVSSQLGPTFYNVMFEDAVALENAAQLITQIKHQFPYANVQEGVSAMSVNHSRPSLKITLDERYAENWVKWRANRICDSLFRGCVVLLVVAMLLNFALSQ